jgi:hypothetical protein
VCIVVEVVRTEAAAAWQLARLALEEITGKEASFDKGGVFIGVPRA